MAYILGLDTGGTYTDGVVIDAEARTLCCKAKAFTTKDDLMRGIAACLSKLDRQWLEQVSMMCLSTTLATNAVVEGRGGRVGIFLLGRECEATLPAVCCCTLRGILDIKGRLLEDIDEQQVVREAEALRGKVDAVAISGFASVRNANHELRVKSIVQSVLGIPVICAHELSSALGFRERTVTAALNAALIPCTAELIDAAQRVLLQYGLDIPLMIVKGDGSLMEKSVARDRPIETVLSGPAASVVGGMFLTGLSSAIVADMGGTTTDLANVENGRVMVSRAGATVGGWRTQLKAAEISTFGIGGDSQLTLDANGELGVGPQRVVPLCVAGAENPGLALELQNYQKNLTYELFSEQYANCFRFLRRPPHIALSAQDERILKLLGNETHSLFWIAEQLERDAEKLELTRLVEQGVLERCGVTPTDVLHVLGLYQQWDVAAALAGVQMFANRLNLTTTVFVHHARRSVERQLQMACLQAVLDFSHSDVALDNDTVQYFLKCAAGQDEGLLKTSFTVCKPIIALGAPVGAWMPAVCSSLGTKVLIPEHAEVANAIGAAVGQITVCVEALIRMDQYHEKYVVHAAWGNEAFGTRIESENWALQQAIKEARRRAASAGCGACQIAPSVKPIFIQNFNLGEERFIETRISVIAVGSPDWR